MRFGQQLGLIAIPEWKQCYLNYQILKIFVMIIKETVQTLEQCEQLQSQNDEHQGRPLIPRISELPSIRERLLTILEEQNQLFYRVYSCQAEITELFYQMKVIQTQEKFEICQRLQSKHVEGPPRLLFLTYLEYAYIEVSYISQMREANLEAERKILKKHKKYSKKRVQTPLSAHDKIGRMAFLEEQYLSQLQDLYVQEQHALPSKQARQFLRETAQKSQTKSLDIFVFGLGVGATVILLGILVGIIQYQGLQIDGANKTVFSRDFPTWRGVAIFILFIWVLGFDVYFFEKYKISHRLILKFDDHHYSPSSYYFQIAGILTAIFMLTFLFYLLQISGVVSQNGLPAQYIVLIVWFSFFAYLFMPLPIFNSQGRLYALKLVGRTLLSPVMGNEFVLAWAADQAISLATPFRDLGYTVCYYTQLDFTDLKSNPCSKKSAFELVLLYVVISISYRVLQCIRSGYQEGKYFCTPLMGNTIKYLFSLVAAVLSFILNSGADSLLWLWILITVIATGYSFYWDLKYDWGLLESNSKNWLLRKYISFQPKRTYYIIMSANLIMRLAWIMTISPKFADMFGNPSLLTFVTGSIEIIRRGIWNLLRIQKEHLVNCKEFRAIPDIKDIQAQLELIPDSQPLEGSQIPVGEVREQIKKEYIVMIKRKIEDRDAQEHEFNQQYQALKIKQVKELKRIIRVIKQANSKSK